jgi:ABC-2 type transport system permease protein
MINWAIFWKTARDSASLILAASLGIAAFVVLFVWAMIDMGEQLLEFLRQIPFIRQIFEFGFGIDISGEVSITILLAVCFTHGVVLMLSWAVVIATTSRVTAGEIERGTADLLLTLPVTRSEVYFSATLVWVIASMVLAICPLIGLWIGISIFETEEEVLISRFVKPAFNFFFLLLAIGGISSLISSCIDRRGLAVATVVGVLLVSVVLNFIEPFIPAIEQIRFLGLLNYFRPVDVVRLGEWPIMEMGVLIALAVVSWTIGLIVFHRKDIPTA